MLEHYEIVELEKKWEEYDKARKKSSFMDKISTHLKVKADKTIYILVFFILICAGSILWLLYGFSHKTTPNLVQENTEEKNLTVSVALEKNKSVEIKNDIPFLNIKDINIKKSEDDGGFVFNNEYEKEKQERLDKPNIKDELIDFGNAPNPPRNLSKNMKVVQVKEPPKINIQTTKLKNSTSLEDKFNETKDIYYALEISRKAYDKGEYKKAIKWALISNEIDKNSVDSWILFAKANYKIGKINDAIIALQSFNKRVDNKEISNLIDDIRNGRLK